MLHSKVDLRYRTISGYFSRAEEDRTECEIYAIENDFVKEIQQCGEIASENTSSGTSQVAVSSPPG
jgi:hypothetical protein